MTKKWSHNHKLFEQAKKNLVGGVNSPVRSFSYVEFEPPIISRGKGPYLFDVDGNKYIDYVLSWGAAILGHAYPKVVNDINFAVKRGLHFGATVPQEIALAQAISKAIPVIEKIRFTNSGTEAVMGAVRLARGFTGRDLIVKFEHSYHGHADYLLAKGGSGLATLGIPSSKGVPKDFVKQTLVVPANDWPAVENIFKKQGDRIAAVLIEPVGGNFGVTIPDLPFLKKLRDLTKKHKSLLIFDEVITGFRFHYGSCASLFDIKPDLITLGKIIGGGLPIGAYGGRKEIMDQLAPAGNVYQASTFAGNPIVMQAGLTTLNVLSQRKSEYKRINELTKALALNLSDQVKKKGFQVDIRVWESMFSIRFDEKSTFKKFYRVMLEQGVYLAPSEFEANFLSFSHTSKEVEKTINAAKKALTFER